MIADNVAKASLLVDVLRGAAPQDAEFADRLPRWMLDAGFLAKLKACEARGRPFRYRTPEQRRLAQRIDAAKECAMLFGEDHPTICLAIDSVLVSRPLAFAETLI